MSEIQWVGGLFVNKPHEKAPDFIKCNLSIKVADLHEWLNKNQHLADDKGYIKVVVKESKQGKWYCCVDDYKPKEDYYSEDGGEEVLKREDVDEADDSIPF